MDSLLYIIKWFFIGGGSFFVLTGALGVLRFPDLFTRLHAASVTDTLGAGMLLTGLMIEAGFTLITIKLVFILVFLFLTSPTSAYALAKAALHGGYKPLLKQNPETQKKPESRTRN